MDTMFILGGLVIFAGIIAAKLGIVSAILEIIVGIIALNFFGFTSTPTIDILANLGILSLMYFAGLEIDFDILEKNLKSSLLIGSTSFIIPFIAIYASATYILNFTIEQALITSIALSTTSIALVYPILLKSGERLDSTGKKILSAAMVVDLLSMIALSIFFSKFSYLTIGVIVALFIFSYYVPYLGKKIFRHYKGNTVEFEFKIILFMILGIGILGEYIGIESVILAFMLGVITSELIVEHAKLWDKLRGITFGFLAPIFFFKVGTTINITSITGNIFIVLFLFAVCFTSNYIGTYIFSKRYMPKAAHYISRLFNAQLSFGIVAATVGYELSYLSQDLYTAIIGTVIISSLVSSLLSKNGYDTK